MSAMMRDDILHRILSVSVSASFRFSKMHTRDTGARKRENTDDTEKRTHVSVLNLEPQTM